MQPEKRKTFCLSVTDEDWKIITEVAERMGFGSKRGRSRAIAVMAREKLKQLEGQADE